MKRTYYNDDKEENGHLPRPEDIRELREKKGITLREVGEILGCSKQNVNQMERGKSKISPPNWILLKEHLSKLADVPMAARKKPYTRKEQKPPLNWRAPTWDKIRSYRKENGLSVTEVIKFLKIPYSHYMKYENDVIDIPYHYWVRLTKVVKKIGKKVDTIKG